jgi:hypothetical protein
MMWLIPGPIRRAIAWLGGAIGFSFLMYGMGQRNKRLKELADRAEANLKAAKRAKDTRHEMETSDDQRLVDILSGVHRDGKR